MKINIKTVMTVCLLMVSTIALAVPAQRVRKTITLADGTKKEVTLVGDENMHFYVDADENVYVMATDGMFQRKERRTVENQWKERLARRNKHRVERAKARGMNLTPSVLSQNGSKHRAQWGAEQNPISGDKKGLVILINFSDKEMNQAHGNEFYDGFFNEEGFDKGGNSGSVHDYFYECSYGQFNLTFDVYGPITVSKPLSYYGENDIYGYDKYAGELTAEACRLVDGLGADFCKYDWDNDGEVDQVYLVYAGYGEHADAGVSTIWPHESRLTDCALSGDGTGPIVLDGVTIDTYAMSPELDGNDGNEPAGIGTACHEFSHCMCLPDFYDVNRIHYGMDSWDLMDYGSYSGPNSGGCPAPYTCYERMYCGWLTPTVLSEPCKVGEMKSLNEASEAYIIYNEKNKNEYYMLANYQNDGFGAYNPAHGLLVLHVYFSSDAWTNNTVNASSIQRMTIIPADGRLTSATNDGDTWPGKSGKTALTDTSSPAASLYVANIDGRKLMGKPIENITESDDGLISFTFNGGISVDTPTDVAATSVTKDGFTASWTAVEDATGYKVELTSTDLEEQEYGLEKLTLLSEDFSGFNNGKTKDGSTDLGEDMDVYTKVSGWTGLRLYTTPGDEVKLGAAKKEGNIHTPLMKTKSHVVTLSFTIRKYGSDSMPVNILIGEETDVDGQNLGNAIQLTSEPVRHVVTTTVEAESFWWGLKCDARCYISEMCAYDAAVTENQIDAGVVSMIDSEVSIVKTEDNSYQFTGLSPLRKYSYRVCALHGVTPSPWSNSVEVTLGNGTSIEGVNENTPSPSRDGGEVYDLAGRKLNSKLPKGIYIVNGKKVVR